MRRGLCRPRPLCPLAFGRGLPRLWRISPSINRIGIVSQIAENRQSRIAILALLLGAVAIGASPIFVRVSEVGPLATGFWRVLLALVPFLVFSQISRQKDERPAGLRDYVLLLLPGVFLAADLVAWHLSLHMTSVANATLFANFAPVFVTLGSWLIFRVRITAIFLAGLGVALAGIVVMKAGPPPEGSSHLAGDATAIVASIFYACYMLSLGHVRARFSTLRIMIWTTVSAAICMLPIALFFETGIVPVSAFGWAVVLGLAFISHAGGQGLITYALAYLPTAFSSLTLLLQPVVAAILAWMLLAEPIGAMQAAGGAIVLLGILLARRG